MATNNLGRVVGKSAYEIWLEQGHTGTEEEFLNSLQGKDGTPGKDGVNGVDGKDYVLTEADKEEISQKVSVNIPTKVGQLENDKNFATESYVANKIAEAELGGGDADLSGLATKDELNEKVDKVAGKSLIDDTEIARLKNVTNYDDTELKKQINSKASITDMTNYIDEHKNELKGVDGKDGTNGVGISSVTQTTTSTTDGGTNIITVTKTDGTTSTFSVKNGTKGSTGEKGTDGKTPVKGTDYWTPADKNEIKEYVKDEIPTKTSQLTNDSGFLTEIELTPEQLNDITEAVVESQTKEFVDSIEECVDPKKQYVLPDGYIYAYKLTEVEVGGYTNVIDITSDDFKQNSRLNANCAISSATVSGAFVSNIFDCKAGDVLRIKGITGTDSSTATAPGFVIARLKEDGSNVTSVNNQAFLKEHPGVSTVAGQQCWNAYTTDENGVITWTYAVNNGGANFASLQGQTGGVKARIAGIATNGLENIVVTVNEEMKEPTIVKEYAWVNTGVSFVPTDNEDRFIAIENDVSELKKDVADLKQNGTGGGSAGVTSDVNWFAFGDSITQGYVSYIKEDGTASSRYSPAGKQSWVYKVAELNGYNVTNYAVGGTGLSYGNPNVTTTAREQVDAVDFTNCDLVTLAWGCNDWKYNGGPVGTVEDNKDTDTTPCASLKYVIEKILSQNPLCKIIVLTPINVCFWGTFEGNYGLSHSFSNTGTLEEFFEAIVSVCEYYGIEYIDNTHSSIFNRANITSLLLDGVHPTAEAYVVMAKELAKKINFK